MVQLSPGLISSVFTFEHVIFEMWTLSISPIDIDPEGIAMLLVDVAGIDIDMVESIDIDIVIEVDMDIDIDIPPPMYAELAPYVATQSLSSVPFLRTSK